MTETTQQTETNPQAAKKQSGFIGRLFEKLDKSMKQKADEKSRESSCCGSSDGKGGKCC